MLCRIESRTSPLGGRGRVMETTVWIGGMTLYNLCGVKCGAESEVPLTEDVLALVRERIRDGVGELRQRIRREMVEREPNGQEEAGT